MNKAKVNNRDVRNEGPSETFEPLIKVAAAAKMLGVEPPTIYGWVETGLIEGLKIGKKAVRIRPESIRALVNAAKKAAQNRVIHATAA